MTDHCKDFHSMIILLSEKTIPVTEDSKKVSG